MKRRYEGTIDELQKLLRKHDIEGSWECEPNNVFMFRQHEGANLHWAARTKSLWFSGDAVLQHRLKRKFEMVLMFDGEHREGA